MAPMTLTLPKLLILLVIGWLVWTFLKRNNIIGGSKSAGTAPRNDRPAKAPKAERAIEDMVKCPKCGAYVPAKGSHECEKA